MKAAWIAALLATTFGLSGPAFANAKLAEEKQCLQCHAANRDTIGPSFRTIGAIYRRMKNPERMIIAVMREGNDANLGPHWGRARMPNGSERPLINDREARQLARWILSGEAGRCKTCTGPK